MKVSLLLFLTFLTNLALAAETLISSATSDIDANISQMFIITDEANVIDSFRIIVKQPGGQINQDDTYPIEQVISGEVVVLMRDGQNILKLRTKNFTPALGGAVVLDYLFNGITGQRLVSNYNLRHQEQGFHLFTSSGVPAEKLFIRGNRSVLFGLIGIRSIEPVRALINQYPLSPEHIPL